MSEFIEPAEKAVAEVISLIEAARDAGTYDDQLTAINDADPRDQLDLQAGDIGVEERWLPLSQIKDLNDALQVSVMIGPEGVISKGAGKKATVEEFTVDVVIECKLPSKNNPALKPLIGFGRMVGNLIALGDDDRPRRITGLDCNWKKTDIIAKFDPALLKKSSVFVNYQRFTFEVRKHA